jgi:hypothetical protein
MLLGERDDHRRSIATGGDDPSKLLRGEDLVGCRVIGGVDNGEPPIDPTLLWCPQLGGRIVDLGAETLYPDVTALLRQDVARQMVNSRLRPRT